MMTAARFTTIARRLFGERYAVPLAAALSLTPSAISRYADPDGNPIPGPVAAALYAWEEDHIQTGRYPPVAPGSPQRFDPETRRTRRGRKPRYLALLAEDARPIHGDRARDEAPIRGTGIPEDGEDPMKP